MRLLYCVAGMVVFLRNSMRLLLMTVDFPPQTGGVARYLDALATYFRDEITVIAPARSDANDATSAYPIQRETLFATGSPAWWPMIRILAIRSEEYDVAIVSHVLPVGTAAMISKWITKKPYVVIVHGLDLVLAKRSVLKKWIAGTVLKNAKLVVANSRSLEAEVRRDFGVERTVAVYPVVVSNPTRPSAPRHGTKLLTVSRLVARKGHLRVLDALKLLAERNQLGDISYEIIGDGPMRDDIEKAIQDRGLQHVVTMVTKASKADVTHAFEQSDIFVMPTVGDAGDREGFGTVYIEAAAQGVPSIATNLPGVDEAVIRDKTGLLIADGDVPALADAIHRLASDEGLRYRLGTAAKERALSEFRPDVQFAKLRSVL